VKPSKATQTQFIICNHTIDEQDRLVWAGNSGTPIGTDHCGLSPSGTTTPPYQQSYSYDALDRITTGAAGTYSYDTNHVHAVTTLSSIPNQYASYDDMGNMTCRNVDPTNAHSCASGTQSSGATMTYDNAGQLESWQAPSGTNETDQYLYDGSGQRVLKHITTTANGVTNTTDTITFNGYTDTTVTDGVTMDTTKYYSVGGQNVVMVNSQGWFTLVPDMQGGSTLVLNANGSVRAVQLFAPYGSVRYSSGSMPTDHNYTGQKLDSTSGLLYYNARYYDPVSGRFISADNVENNSQGNDPYAYVKGNPVTATDPTGHGACNADGECTHGPGAPPPSDPTMSGGGGGDSGGDSGPGWCNAVACFDGSGNVVYYKHPTTPTTGGGNSGGGGTGNSGGSGTSAPPAIIKPGPSQSQVVQMKQDRIDGLNSKAWWEKVGSDVLAAIPYLINIISNAKDVVTRIDNFIGLANIIGSSLLPDIASKYPSSLLLSAASTIMEAVGVLQTYLAIIQGGALWATKVAEAGATLILDTAGGPGGAMLQGLLMFVQPVLGGLLNAGSSFLASLSYNDSAEATKESNMSAQSWYTQYGGCSIQDGGCS
jgi:RHS repeat-associated core domain